LRQFQLRYAANLSINELASSLGYDRTTLYKLFIKNVGVSPMEYLEGLKIIHACELIKERQLTLNQIAEKVGFASYVWFNKVFKRVMKVAPSEYLQMYESGNISGAGNGVLEKIEKAQIGYHEFFVKNVLL